ENEENLIRDLDLSIVRQARDNFQFYRDRRPDTYDSITAPCPAPPSSRRREHAAARGHPPSPSPDPKAARNGHRRRHRGQPARSPDELAGEEGEEAQVLALLDL